ncbi:MAG TPA: DHH family phosphoesterase [Patescibacteria group bacterium]|nr:DHH family phosphoesterase [Patescibacteria group bacterium]
MLTDEKSQLIKTVESKKNILITFRENARGDAIAAALGLRFFLEKLGKNVEIVCNNFHLPKQLRFLPQADSIRQNFSHLQKFIISIDVSRTGVKELSYDTNGDRLKLFITPEKNFLNKDDVQTAQSDFKYDLIFVLDSQDLESLGSLYDNNQELFFQRPVINIDYHASNEHFGQINLIDLAATSVAELVFTLLAEWKEENINKEVAAALLTGMIFNTNSFKTQNVRPHTLATASRLMHLGADRDHIVQNLYRTRSLSTLKLWGQALSHLTHESNLGLVWTSITRDDFIRSGANAHDLYEIVEELISNSPEAKLILLFHEQQTAQESDRVHVILDTTREYNARELLSPFTPVVGDKKQATTIVIGQTLKEVEQKVLNHLRQVLPQIK